MYVNIFYETMQTTNPLPQWILDLKSVIKTGQSSVVLLHGNIRDFFPFNNQFYKIREYLKKVILSEYQYTWYYDPQGGIQFFDKETRAEFFQTLSGYDAYHHTSFSKNPPKEPGIAFSLIENLSKVKVVDQKSCGGVIEYLDHLVPASETNHLSAETRYLLIALDKWAQNPQFIENSVVFFLISENLSRLHEGVTRNPYIPKIHIPHPNLEERSDFAFKALQDKKIETDLEAQTVGLHTAGLSLLQLSRLFSDAATLKKPISTPEIKSLKKKFIEAECTGLLEFVEPKFNLSNVAGHSYAKKMLSDTSKALKEGKTSYLPMGYLISGPVGTGKTFLVNCFAGEVGIPVVKFLNFRSQWQGATEANLEKIINLLKAAYPVVVLIDEADAFLGDRNQQGDSGTSSRVFASLAAFMGDTEFRGKILWFLMTSRPDLLPIDMKRQGRAEEHIALFHPQNADEEEELFISLARKNQIGISGLSFTKARKKGISLSGADIESILIRAALQSQLKNEPILSQESLDLAAQNFLSPNYPLEMELQILVALRECTNRELIPKAYMHRNYDDISARINTLLLLLRDA